MADTVSIGLLTGQIIGVWGNAFNREAFGEYTDSLFAMQIPLELQCSSSAVTKQMRDNLVMVLDEPFIQVHPLFLYESIWCLLLLIVLLILGRRKSFFREKFSCVILPDTDWVNVASNGSVQTACIFRELKFPFPFLYL